MNPALGNSLPYVTFFLAVIAATWVSGYRTGLFSVLLSVVLSWVSWLGRAQGYTVDLAALVSLAIFSLVAGAVVFVVHLMRQAEARKKLERDRFLVMLGSIDEAVITVDLDCRIRFMNAKAEGLLGRSGTQTMGLKLRDVMELVDCQTQRRLSDQLLAPDVLAGNCRSLTSDAVLTGRDGRQTAVSDSVAPLLDCEGRVFGVALMLRDITLQKEHEAAKREAESRKDEFLAILAHELRNPLNPLQSALSVLNRRPVDPVHQTAAMQIMQRQVDQLVRLVDDLMDVSLIQTGRLELRQSVIALTAVISAATEAVQPLFEFRQQMFDVVVREDAVIQGDVARLTQVLTNILNNASKYTPQGGRIALLASVAAGEAKISVSDTGIGMTQDDMLKIFDLFTRVEGSRRSIDGLGIGLGVAKRLTEMHGGRIEVVSSGLDRGSTFIIALPVLSSAAANDLLPAAAGLHVANASPLLRKVLLVDDNEDGTSALAALLESMDYEVATANSGRSALERFETFQPDAAVLDIGLPDLSGYELARRMRASQSPALKKLIALSGWGTQRDIETALLAGFDAHVTKPITIDRIVELLNE